MTSRVTEADLFEDAKYLAGLRHGFVWGFFIGFATAMTFLAVVCIVADAWK